MKISPVEATKLIRLFVEDRPPAENRLTAYTILSAACYGAPEEEIEKKSEAPAKPADSTTNSQTESSGSEPSTASAES